MQLNHFRLKFSPDAVALPDPLIVGNSVNLIEACGGISFGGGLYRLVSGDLNQQLWNDRIALAFPEFRGVVCFGFDWLGRAFATTPNSTVLMLEPGTGQALKIPVNIETFHDQELVEYGEEALAVSFYNRWRESESAPLNYGQCVGYKIPLFLGGVDDLSNLEVSDLDVYWHMIGQMIRQVFRK